MLRLLAVLAGLTLVVNAWAQQINPTQDDDRLPVTALLLAGVDNTHAGALRPEKINQRLLLERSRFGETMTVDELHQVADALTLYFRTSGYAFHTVYLPPQRVEDGMVELRLQEGVLIGVNVINQTPWPDERLHKPFDKLLGTLMYAPEVEERVHALRAQNGLRVYPYYSRGQKNGEAVLNLRVDPTDKRAFSLKADNYGSPASGKSRVILQYSEYQLTGRHDRLSLALLHAVDGVANTYGSIAYQLPFGGLDYAWDISASNNQFEVGDRFAALGLKGDATTLRTGLTAITRHHTSRRAAWRLGIYEKRSNIEVDDTPVANELSQAVSLQWTKSLRFANSATLLQSLLEYSYGQYEIEELPDGDFNKLDFSLLFAKGLGAGRWRNLWQLNTRGQYSDAMLPSIESLGLSGAYGVRGYPPGVFSADSALLTALEWRWPNLLSKGSFGAAPFLFGEYARGYKEDVSGARQYAQLAGTGIGLSANWGRNVAIQVVAARGAAGKIDGVKVEGDDQVLFEIRLQ